MHYIRFYDILKEIYINSYNIDPYKFSESMIPIKNTLILVKNRVSKDYIKYMVKEVIKKSIYDDNTICIMYDINVIAS